MDSSLEELDAIRTAYSNLEHLNEEGRERSIAWLASALGVKLPEPVSATGQPGAMTFGDADGVLNVKDLSAKQFMATKKPSTAVERVTCLGFYMAYGKDTPHFKTKDLTDANREAAGAAFSNISQAAKDAVKANYLASAGKGARQVTALGEEIVNALPDRAKVKDVLSTSRPSRRRRPGQPRRVTQEGT